MQDPQNASFDPSVAAVSVVFGEASTDASLRSLLDRSGFFHLLRNVASANPTIILLVDLAGFDPANPGVAARKVEAMVDVIGAETAARLCVATSADSSSAWAGNRDVYARAELAGFRYVSDHGHEYDIIDLGEELIDDGFAAGSALSGTPASRAWAEADVRIVMSGLRADAAHGFAAGLETLIGALPLADSVLEYRQRRDIGEVAAALLAAMPPHFALVDARASGGPLIASPDIVLADYAAALKLGIDPEASPLFAKVVGERPLPASHHFIGDLAPLADCAVPTPWAAKLARARTANFDVATLTDPWLQPLDTAAFPLLHPIDARLNAAIASLDGGSLRAGVDLFLALVADAMTGWQTLCGKDALERRTVALGMEPGSVPVAAFDTMQASLDSLVPVARSAMVRGDGLRWRKVGGAVVFSYARDLAIPFDHFVGAVDVARAISFMSDYLGGVVRPHDCAALPPDGGRQLERNLYLPQPNYLVLFGGKPIDVTKIEVVRRRADCHQLYWQTLFSSNDTASADDGIISFTRTAGGTAVEIIGKQKFTLPPFWQLFDVSLLPSLESALVTHAYQAFFDGTLANFEALVEGRDIAIGRDPASAPVRPVLALETLTARIAEIAEPSLAQWRAGRRAVAPADPDGYVHGHGQ